MKIYLAVSSLSGAVSPVCWLYVIMKPCVGGIVPLGSLANFVFIHPQAKITQTIFFTPDRGVSSYTRSSCSTQELTIAPYCSNTQKKTQQVLISTKGALRLHDPTVPFQPLFLN